MNMQGSVGKPIPRLDGKLKVTGHAVYSAEQRIPRLAYAVLVTSTIPKGRILTIDSAAAQHVPGVLAIVTHLNAQKLPALKPPPGATPRSADRKLQLLQDNHVLYANQPVAVAVAESLEAAEQAAALVHVRYAPQLHAVDFEKRLLTAYTPKKVGGRGDPAETRRGDIAAGLAQATVKIEHVYTTPFETHNPMEPHATIAVWDGPAKLTLYDATQGIFGDRERVAGLLGLKPDDVRVVSPFLGGGFGSKGPTWSHVVLAAMAARHVKRPVKLVLDRPQMFGPVGFRSRTRQTLTLGAKSDGTLTALRHDTVSQTSSFDEFAEAACLPSRMLYSCPNNQTSQKLVRADIGTPSFMRAPGQASGNFALESAMDELAYALKMDPLELRLKNYSETDPERNLPYSSKALRECYRQGAERFGWSRRRPEPRSMRDGNVLIGWGMATSVYPTHRTASSARAAIRNDGRILVESGTQDLGTGTYTVMTQMAADALGVPLEEVTFRLGETDFPETPVSGGSQTAASTGSAVHLAALALREKLVTLAISDAASPVYKAKTEDVLIDRSRIALRGARSKTEPLQALLRRHDLVQLEAQVRAEPGDEIERYSMYAHGAQFAEVRIDADLGQVRVSRMIGCFAAGRILNARTARSQFQGGMVWGIGMALLEDSVMDERLGRIVNNNLADYHVPVNADVPAIDAFWVEERDEHVNPLGVKGIGEIGITGAAAAIANAVYHATGKRIRDLPITPDKLL
jgi:xanthine dehydrogenase YagR molybdenum-binding subunit